ncbi:signal peptidase I [Oscillochloris sp. ZM17-4]|uniref:signal peptidase I n=1 Tax=Oscillochloris sp. ZM17-4 TaxID=2866714 RepID=UPI00351CDBF8
MRVRSVVRELLETAIFILLVFFIVRGIVQNFKIEGSSMEPTLHTGEYILVNKLVYFHFDLNAPLRLLPGQESLDQKIIYPFHQPRRGDILVFEYPRDVSKDYIKRVIGLPGDTLDIHDGKVFVNGSELSEPYLGGAATACLGSRVCGSGPFVIPDGTIFVMGDNRNNSSDSREWDSLPLDRVVGQAWVIYYPVSSWGLVPHHDY